MTAIKRTQAAVIVSQMRENWVQTTTTCLACLGVVSAVRIIPPRALRMSGKTRTNRAVLVRHVSPGATRARPAVAARATIRHTTRNTTTHTLAIARPLPSNSRRRAGAAMVAAVGTTAIKMTSSTITIMITSMTRTTTRTAGTGLLTELKRAFAFSH